MGTATNTLENSLRGAILNNTSYVVATTYLALFSSAPGEAGGGTEATGGTGPYARQSVAWTLSGTAGVATNTSLITFAGMPAGTWTDCALFDAATSGNMLMYSTLSAAITTNSGDSVTFAAGTGLTVTID